MLCARRRRRRAGGERVKLLLLTPFMGMLVLCYAGMRLWLGGASMARVLEGVVLRVHQLPSVQSADGALAAPWELRLGDLFVTVGLLFLALELVKATNYQSWSMANHGLSLVTLLVCILLFVLVPGFATSPFFFLTAMSLVDVSVGGMITTSTARRQIGIGGGGGD